MRKDKTQVPEQVRDQVPMYVAEGLILERQKTKEEMERMIAKAILQEHGNIQAEISLQIHKAIDNQTPSKIERSMKFENLQVQQTTCRPSAVRPRDQDDPHDDGQGKKLKFICHWANLFKDFERSNVPGIKLSSLSESDNTFTSLQALSNLHYLLSGFMDYFWSRKLNISNFGPANR
ncbi:hypothetical protein Tco_1547378 [Tanacetum coccineum]